MKSRIHISSGGPGRLLNLYSLIVLEDVPSCLKSIELNRVGGRSVLAFSVHRVQSCVGRWAVRVGFLSP